MGSDYRPVSPDLSGTSTHRPASPRPVSPDLSGLGAPGQVAGNFHPQHHQHGRFGGAFGGAGLGAPPMSYSPTSAPPQPHYQHMQQYQPPFQPVSNVGAPFTMKQKDEQDEYLPDAGVVKRPRKGKESKSMGAFAQQYDAGQFDPTLGVELKTSFPVARIKRIMQADEDIGKVAQVTPHVVSRALELFMIKMIAASAAEARGGGHAGGGKGAGKKITPQHLKQAVLADDTFDFLHEIVSKVPDAPTRVKKEAVAGSESEEEKKPRRRAKRRKDSDDI